MKSKKLFYIIIILTCLVEEVNAQTDEGIPFEEAYANTVMPSKLLENVEFRKGVRIIQ